MNKLTSYFPLIILLLFSIIIGHSVYIKLVPIPADSRYVGSKTCLDCHDKQHAQWQSSLHPKMMRKANNTGVMIADFSHENQDVQFNHTDAVWVIGSKWEQQFMGHDGETETLLPGAWLIEQKKWNTKNWDGWRTPEPLVRCHGCHTVGLDVDSGEFVEPGIGCESCHGPSSWHVETGGNGKVISTLDAQVCGQCHSRGKSKDDRFFYPVGYKPGENLDEYFIHQEPDYIQNSSTWWGHGRERKRHQEYYAWKQGGHANSLKSLLEGYDGRYGELKDDCLSCHAAKAILAGQDSDLSIEDAQFGITCAVCHYVHGDLEKVRIGCEDCHRDGAYYHQSKKNANHVICPTSANVQCINCHMPLTAKSGGKIQLHSHAPGIVPPELGVKFDAPSSCANGACHSDTDREWLQKKYELHYGKNKNKQLVQNDFINAKMQLK